MNNNEDKGSFGWAVLGFFFPFVGLILFLCWINTKKKSATQVGVGALVGFFTKIIFAILGVILFSVTIFGLISDIDFEEYNSCAEMYGENYESEYVDGTLYCRNKNTKEMILPDEEVKVKETNEPLIIENKTIEPKEDDLLKTGDASVEYGVLVNKKIDNFSKLNFTKQLIYPENDDRKISFNDNTLKYKDLDIGKKEQKVKFNNVKSIAISCDCGNCHEAYFLTNDNKLYVTELDGGYFDLNKDGTIKSKSLKLLNNNVVGIDLIDYGSYDVTTCGGYTLVYKDLNNKVYAVEEKETSNSNYEKVKILPNQLQRVFVGEMEGNNPNIYAVNDVTNAKKILKDGNGNNIVANKIFALDNDNYLS